MIGLDKLGFSYGGVHSSTFDIVANRDMLSALPEQRKYTTTIPSRDGYVDYGIGGYSERTLTVDIYYLGELSKLRGRLDEITAWLANVQGKPKRLIFDDAPDRHYMAKIFAPIELTVSPTRHIGTIVFECNPPWAIKNEIELSPENLLWDTMTLTGDYQYTQALGADKVRFTVKGSAAVKPIIKLIGYIEDGVTLTVGSDKFTYSAGLAYDGIIIDCNDETVTRASDGANLFGNVSPTENTFFELETGAVEMEIEGATDKLTLIIEYEPIGGDEQ